MLEGVPTDYAFAYAAGKNSSAWSVKDETYDWKIQMQFNKVVSVTKLGSRPNVKDDKLVFTLAPDIANETITLDFTGRVQWAMTGKRATGATATGNPNRVAR